MTFELGKADLLIGSITQCILLTGSSGRLKLQLATNMGSGQQQGTLAAMRQTVLFRRGFLLMFLFLLVALSVCLLTDGDRLVFGTPTASPLMQPAVHYSTHHLLEQVPKFPEHTQKGSRATYPRRVHGGSRTVKLDTTTHLEHTQARSRPTRPPRVHARHRTAKTDTTTNLEPTQARSRPTRPPRVHVGHRTAKLDTAHTSRPYHVTNNTVIPANETPRSPLRSLEGSEAGADRGYILTLHYSGQQAAGITALMSQQCWMGSFDLPMLLVEPFVKTSILSAQPESSASTLKFSDYYDIKLYTAASTAEGYGHLASWDEFLHQAPRKVILMMMNINTESSTRVLWESSLRHPDECFEYGKTNLGDLQNVKLLTVPEKRKLQVLTNYSFCVVKVVLSPYAFASMRIFTATEMKQVVFGQWDPRQVTMVFTIWRGGWLIPNPRLQNPEVCKQPHSRVTDQLFSGPQLVQAAQRYERQFLNPRTSVAVMLRAEHVVDALRPVVKEGQTSVQVEFNNCLQDTLARVNRLRKVGSVFVTADVGTYGSGAWNMPLYKVVLGILGEEKVFAAVKKTVTELYDNQLSFEEWESTFTNVTDGMDDRGYIAALQKTLASRADCLVLVGGGSFLKLALREYLHMHPRSSTWCVEIVCSIRSSAIEYEKIIEDARSTVKGDLHA